MHYILAFFLIISSLIEVNQPISWNNVAWVMTSSPRPKLGQFDMRSNIPQWIESVSLPKQIIAASTSHSGKYLALVSFAEAPSVYIYQLGQNGPLQLVPYEVLTGFSEILWSPDSDEALLARSYWDNPVIWESKDKTFEAVKIASDICSIQWGVSSNQVLVSTCKFKRAIIAWDRSHKSTKTLLHFNYVLQNEIAAFSELHSWSPDRHKLLIFTYVSDNVLPETFFEMPVILTGYWQILDITTMNIVTLSEKVDSSIPRIGFFRTPSELVIGVSVSNSTELRKIRLENNKVNPSLLFRCRNNCIRGATLLATESKLLLQLDQPLLALRSGLYLADLTTGFKPIRYLDSTTRLLPTRIGMW